MIELPRLIDSDLATFSIAGTSALAVYESAELSLERDLIDVTAHKDLDGPRSRAAHGTTFARGTLRAEKMIETSGDFSARILGGAETVAVVLKEAATGDQYAFNIAPQRFNLRFGGGKTLESLEGPVDGAVTLTPG